MMIRTNAIVYKEMMAKISAKNVLECEERVNGMVEADKEKFRVINKEYDEGLLLFDKLRK